MTLLILSLLLWWRGYFKFNWIGVTVAMAVVAVTLIPWAQTVLQDPSLLPRNSPRNGRLAQTLLSASRGLGYWIRYPALIASSTILCWDFSWLSSALAGDPVRHAIQVSVGLLTLPITIWANVRLWSNARGWWRRRRSQPDFRSWLVGVVRWSFVGTLVACIATPTAVMSWQLLTVLHFAVLPLVLCGLHLTHTGHLHRVRIGAGIWAALSLVLIVGIGLGSPMFRCGGKDCGAMNADPPPLRANHTMLDALGINATCQYEVNVNGGWWPDVLPEQ